MNFIVSARSYCSNTSCTIKKSAKIIRNEFIDYFKQNLGHTFIRSSPVVPLHDHSVAFVNAGMNQFKGIFLNYYDLPVKKAVNSQKCIRVSGKHNDLNLVGNDTYHHTFFEMLGNWSFGDYFKEEACLYAWNLLTKQFNINKELLYVTYFGGDEKLGLEPDLECKDIWLNIGVAENRIIPCGMKDNFWEMGLSGPCGPSTEIHIDYKKQLLNQSMEINTNSALTELWNIVFIQYQRLEDGTLVPLPKHHVDTGMGFERLVALLQGKESNYDTDLFQPLFETIQNYTKAPAYTGKFYNDEVRLDYGYRILADHSRTISVALADGMIPEKSNKLRKIIRRAINIGDQVFKKQGILSELSYAVAENLGDVYPELQNNLKAVQKIINFEEKLFEKLLSTSAYEWKKIVDTHPHLISISDWTASGLAVGYKYLQEVLNDLKVTNTLSADVAFNLYDRFGLRVETIRELAEAESLSFSEEDFQDVLNKHKSKLIRGFRKSDNSSIAKCMEMLERNHVPKTDDSFKYTYTFDGDNYQFPVIDSKIVALFVDDNIIFNNTTDSSIKSNSHDIGIILDKTVCYSYEYGQKSDTGFICTHDLTFNVTHVEKQNGYVIHFGQFTKGNLNKWNEILKVGDSCKVSITPKFRVGLMQCHTGAHLLNACMKQIIQGVYLRDFYVKENYIRVQYNTFEEELSLEQLQEIEKRITCVISANVPVTTKVLNSSELLAEDSVTLIPRKIYPYTGIRLVEIDFQDLKSKEICNGTHVSKTGMLKDFCFLHCIVDGTYLNITAAVGLPAAFAKLTGETIIAKICNLEHQLKTNKFKYQAYKSTSKSIANELKKQNKIPYIIKENCLTKLKWLDKFIDIQAKKIEKSSINADIRRQINLTSPFIVYCLHKKLEHLSLEEVASLFPDVPIIVIEQIDGTVKAWCSIPKDTASNAFNARRWMEVFCNVFDIPYKSHTRFGQCLSASMKIKNIPEDLRRTLLEEAVCRVKTFASTHLESNLTSTVQSK